jgi:CubicO group peptidase (beta-lactamase class C family)
MNRLLLMALALLLTPVASPAGELPRADPAAVGLSAEGLAGLKPALRKLVDDGQIAGGVALIARHGQVAYVEPFGFRDLATRAAMTEDTIFAIASMTKPITCVAAMTLVEGGKLGLDDPVAKYLPELKDLRVLGEAGNDTPEGPAMVPARRPITIRDLFTHTSGLAYGGFLSADRRLGRAYDQAGVQGRGLRTIAEQVERLAKVPLAHQPGERWTYGLSHDVLGRVIEVASGRRFDEYLQERVFGPLDLRDTSFAVPTAKRGRVATIYRTGLLGGALTPLPIGYGSETLFSGGGGLFSTARDYARFAQMLLNGGELDGVRILQPESIARMTTNQIGGKSALGLFKYGLGFGLEMVRPPGGGEPAPARYFWGGLFSTNFWVDPRNDVVAVILTQVLPTNHGGADRVLRRAVDAAIVKPAERPTSTTPRDPG